MLQDPETKEKEHRPACFRRSPSVHTPGVYRLMAVYLGCHTNSSTPAACSCRVQDPRTFVTHLPSARRTAGWERAGSDTPCTDAAAGTSRPSDFWKARVVCGLLPLRVPELQVTQKRYLRAYCPG